MREIPVRYVDDKVVHGLHEKGVAQADLCSRTQPVRIATRQKGAWDSISCLIAITFDGGVANLCCTITMAKVFDVLLFVM